MKKHSLVLLSLLAMVTGCAPKKAAKAPTQTDLPKGGTTIKESDEANYKADIKKTLEGALTLDGVSAVRYDASVSVKASGLHKETEYGLLTAANVSAEADLTVKDVNAQYKTFGLELKNVSFVATLDGKKTDVLKNLTLAVYLVEGEEKCMGYFDLSNASFKTNLQLVAKLLMGEDNYDPALFSDTIINAIFGKQRRGYLDLTDYMDATGLSLSKNAPISESLIPLFTAFILPSVLAQLDDITERVAALHPVVKNYSDKSYGFAINSTVAAINSLVGKEDEENTLSGNVGLSLKSGSSTGSAKPAFEQSELKADLVDSEENTSYEIRVKLNGTYDAQITSNPAASFKASDYPKDYSQVYEKIMNIIHLVDMVS